MTPIEYFEFQAFFNKNLKEMSAYDRAHVIKMISEYAIMQVEECRKFVLGQLKEWKEETYQSAENQTINNDR